MTKEIINKIMNYAEKAGYPKIEPAGLLYRRAGYPFNPSAGHHIADTILLNKAPVNPTAFSVSERCMREVDASKIGISNRHLTFFEMIEFSEVGDSSKLNHAKLVEDIYNILTKQLKLKKENLLITALDKCKIDNLIVSLKDTKKTYEVWKKILGEDKIILTRGRRNFFITRQPKSPGGVGYEIYYKLPNGEFIEIASQVNYKYVFYGFNNIRLVKNENLACGFGLERLQMVFENKEKIHEISSIKPIKEIVLNMLEDNREKILYDENAAIIADHIRTITFIVYDSAKRELDNTQNKILKRFIKKLKSEIDYLGIENKTIYDKLVQKTIDLYKDRYPLLTKEKDKILEIINL
jgi:alanyl-tRNA synthetase